MIFHFFRQIGKRADKLRKVQGAVLAKHGRFQRDRAAVIRRHLCEQCLKIDDPLSGMQDGTGHAPHAGDRFS